MFRISTRIRVPVLSDLVQNLQFGPSKEQKKIMVRHYSMFSFQTSIIGHLLNITGPQHPMIATLDLVMIEKPTTESITGKVIHTKS